MGKYLHEQMLASIRLRFENLNLLAVAEAAQKEAEQSNHEKSRFLSSASHDLRQPIHALDLFADALEQRVVGDEQKILAKMRSSIDAMGGLLHSILDLSKLDAGLVQVDTTAFSLTPMLNRLASELSVLAQEKGINLSVTSIQDDTIESDTVLFESIVRNLLSNAIKYTDSGTVSLSCRIDQHHCIIRIKDTGVGISDEEQAKVFHEFYQVNNSEQDRSKGIGLGLAIVQRSCQLLGHILNMQSKLGEGTIFEVSVPISKVKVASQIPAMINTQLNAVVIVIDDEKEIREGMESMLIPWGCDVLSAESLEEVKRIIRTDPLGMQKIDLIVADYHLRDGLNGLDAILAIRESLALPHLPALIISGDTEAKRMQEMKEVDLQVLYKPVKAVQMRAMMRHLLR